MAFRIPDDDGTDEYVVTLRGPVLTAAEEQKKWLQEALIAVDRKAAIMRSSMESQDSMAVVIRAAAQMLDELRTNLLEPQNYYELYMKVFSMMEVFVAYLEDEHRAKRHTLEEMYERVQFCGYIVPRLYLLIAAGAVYIDAGDQPALEIARDLVEMCKGVQHPTRGLFLRHFLLTMMKGKLPGDPNRRVSDVGNESAGEAQEEYPHKEDGGTVTDTANLLVQNFKEMNWLWIRMEAGSYTNRNGGSTNSVTACSPTTAALPATSPPPAASAAASSWSSDAATRPGSPPRSLRAARRTQQERRAMCVLVGMNVVRVAQLDGISRDVYASTILPQLLSIMVRYCEPLAQQYLFEVLIQVFPDEFHLFTIDKLFGAISRTVPGVEVSELFRSLMERLCKYAVAVQEGVTEVSSPEEEAKLRDVFPMLLNQMSCMSVSYSAQMSTTTVIKRTSTVPPPTPMMLGAYVTAMRHLVNVVMTLYGKSAKRRFMSLSNIVDVVASKFPSAVVDSSESKESTGVVETAAASAETSTPVSISPAAALAAGQFLVHIITECCATVQEVMAMEGIAALTSCLPFLQRREVAMAVCEVALRGSTAAPVLPSVSKAASSGAGGGVLKPTVVVTVPPPLPRPITALEDVARLFELLDPILVEQPDAPSDLRLIYKYNPAVEFVDEQNLVCRILHLLANDDPAVYAKMLTGVRKVLLQGGARRIPLTYPTLMTLHRRAALRLYAQYQRVSSSSAKSDEGERDGDEADTAAAAASQAMKAIRKCFSHVHSGDSKGILEVFAVEAPTEALKEYLFCSNTADVCEQSETSYALYAEALTLYEGHIEESHEQIDVLVACVNALCQMRNMPEENYEVLAAKVCQYASKMLKKHDQSYLVAVCAALFAKKQLSRENQQRVQECLRRSLKLAGQVLALAQLQLYVQLLNIFLHFFTSKSGYLVSVELVNELIEKISEASEVQRSEVGGDGKNSTADDDDSDNAANTFAKIRLVYRNITKYIRSRQSAEERWNEIDV
ncbi:vacuolar sorting-associated-like protein [Leishmania infantum JPCM5]|uniref:Vacuolar protein sorting-associated protein 35 n=2 Tax=Leishmania infantum TaxID=5671 RepID=A0A6L0XM72_LEIIN|nr:vacuolar sorting-associated-like protein [Leishmania infantum JPCM5]CAC9485543.1 vacuolar_sorting-associated-like_protein [Leishmania infantum]CAM67779.1 vacuolar sorting-associated-like protein [Leishmania infantum JPCM5]SUZ41509.1 vacuolar_sorting-associated-like_protein [Leishmania infantum]|eukprot:XP_001465358.1 vacuolar sorting-associated-like protein [Leishmania infantum JPCM5]